MITLGIDQSLTGFGWLIHDSTKLGESRVIASGVVNTAASEVFVSRYASLRSLLVHVIDQHPEIENVGVESTTFGATWSEGAYALFVYVNEAIYLSRRDVVYFDPSTVKMLARMDPSVRKGTMAKEDMVAAAKAETGIKKWNHNVADAYIIARSAARFWEFYSGILSQEDLTPSEVQSFSRVHTFKKGPRAGQTVKGGLVFREDSRFHRFSQVPPNPVEEELRQWLARKGLEKATETIQGAKSPRRRKR